MPNDANQKIVGVLGGMGPYATLAFFKALLDQTPAKKDWDHARVIIDNNPHIPSRTRYLLHNETSPLEGMFESCARLQAYPVDFIVVPCNSAAIFIPELRARIRIPIVNICEVTADALARRFPAAKRVVVLGAYVTYKKRSYEPLLAVRGIDLVDHEPEVQRSIERLIEDLKLGTVNSEQTAMVGKILGDLKQTVKIDAAIFGCTELSCLPALRSAIPTIDSNTELAKFTVGLARNEVVIAKQ